MFVKATSLRSIQNSFVCIARQNITLARRFASESYPPHTLVKMPALSPTMTQGNIGQWHKKIGDELQPGDILVEIETDKAQMDMECQDEGFLAKIFIDAGEKDVDVNTPICVLAENKEDVEKFASFKPTADSSSPHKVELAPSKSVEPKTSASPKQAPTPNPPANAEAKIESKRIFASPLAKTLAAEKGIKLSDVKGSGPLGRVLKNDILNFKRAPATKIVAAASTSSASPGPQFTDIPLSNVRKVIADRLAESKSTIPHYYMTQEIDVTKVLKLREALNKESNGKFKLSVNDFVVKASSLALLEVPAMNSSWNGTFIRQFQNADIAVAVATETGLITPIVHTAQNLGLSKISNKVKALAEKARAGKLAPQEYQGGTFTISNLGMYGVKHFTAIINPPHAAILAVGGISDKLVLDEESAKGFKVSKIMTVTLSPDHRIVDGAVAAQWIQKFQAYLENPLNLLL